MASTRTPDRPVMIDPLDPLDCEYSSSSRLYICNIDSLPARYSRSPRQDQSIPAVDKVYIQGTPVARSSFTFMPVKPMRCDLPGYDETTDDNALACIDAGDATTTGTS